MFDEQRNIIQMPDSQPKVRKLMGNHYESERKSIECKSPNPE